MREELGNVLCAKFTRVALVVKENILFNPMDVGFFRPDTVMLEADDGADLLKKSRHGEVTSKESIKSRES
jgi:hypothetical protein